jgi:prepilin-type N-terminal cleavage/methylation domain-containing protein
MLAASKKSYPSSKDGFTLVEVIVSMFLMATVFTAAFGSYFLGMRIIEDARDQVRASQIIQSELEKLRTANWDQLENMLYAEPLKVDQDFATNYAKDYVGIRYLWDVTAGQQKWVVVIVTWKNSRGLLTRQVFNTVFTKDGLNDYYYREI